MDKNRKNGFTLAEVLITLTIIGVIAALTIPNLMQKYQEQTTVKKLQKFYSNLANAYSLAIKDNGIANEWGLAANEEGAIKVYDLLFKPYFKIGKNCGTASTGDCIPKTAYKRLNNTTSGTNDWKGYYKVALDDGAIIFWRGAAQTDYVDIFVFYDINGVKEPNQWGKDLFEFVVLNKSDKVVPTGIESGKYSYARFSSYCNKNSDDWGCAAWVVYKGNMDYLHCDLTWDKHSCKDK